MVLARLFFSRQVEGVRAVGVFARQPSILDFRGPVAVENRVDAALKVEFAVPLPEPKDVAGGQLCAELDIKVRKHQLAHGSVKEQLTYVFAPHGKAERQGLEQDFIVRVPERDCALQQRLRYVLRNAVDLKPRAISVRDFDRELVSAEHFEGEAQSRNDAILLVQQVQVLWLVPGANIEVVQINLDLR